MFPTDPLNRLQFLATAVLVGSFLWASVETRLSIRLARELNLLAPVTPRSAHRVPTPTIGGMAIGDTVLLVAILLNLFVGLHVLTRSHRPMIYPPGVDGWMCNWVLILCGLGIMVMGFVDDWKTIRPRGKFLVQILCALPPAWYFRHGSWIGEETWPWLSGLAGGEGWMWLTFAFNLAWMLVVINIFNFMDGMDGLAGMFTAVVAGVIGALVLLQSGELGIFEGLGEILFTVLALAGAILGFLRLNLPPAQTFMGDVGSQFLGWLLAMLALMAHVPLAGAEAGQRLWPNAWAPLLLFLPILGDGLFTMGRRALHGENIFTPHFTHLYQRLLTCGRTHAQVLFIEALIMFACAALTLSLLHVGDAFEPLLGVAGLGVMVALWLSVRAAETATPSEER